MVLTPEAVGVEEDELPQLLSGAVRSGLDGGGV